MDKQCFYCKQHIGTYELLDTNNTKVDICFSCLKDLLCDGSIVNAYDDDGSGQRQIFTKSQNALSTYNDTMFLSRRFANKLNYLLCPKCGKLHSDKNTKNRLCPKCSEKYGFIICGKCGSWIHNSEIVTNSKFCKNCVSDTNDLLINKYHTSHKFDYCFFGFKGNPEEFCGLGFELEIDVFKQIDKKKFKSDICRIVNEHNALTKLFIEKDSSLLNGIELISQPHTITEMRKFIDGEMTAILSDLQKQTPAEDCSPLASLHVHISRKVFGNSIEEQNNNIAKLIYWTSRNIGLLMTVGRRETFRKCAFPEENISMQEALDMVEDPESRYVAINLCNENTVEFRFMQTTTYADILRALVDFCWYVATQIILFDWQDLDGIKLLNRLPDNVLEYFRNVGVNLKNKGGN